MRKLLFFVFVLGTVNFIQAQQTSLINHEKINTFFINPANSGINNKSNVYLLYRNQWKGFPGAPETAMLTIDGSVKSKKIGLGLIFSNDNTHIIGQTKGLGAFSYHFNTSKTQKLYLGLSVGFIQNRIYFDRIDVDDFSDLTIQENMETMTNFDANFGLTYKFRDLEFGFITAQLLAGRFQYEKQADSKELRYSMIRHYLGTLKYDFKFKGTKHIITPSVLVRSVQGATAQFEGGALYTWKESMWGGVTYRHGYGLSFMAGLKLYQNITASYSYDYSLNDISDYSGGTHEILLGFHFTGKRKDSEDYGLNNKRKNYKDMKKMSQEQFEKMEELELENEKLKKEIKKNEDAIKNQKEEIDRLENNYKKDEKEIEEIIKRYRYTENKSDSVEIEDIDKDKSFYVIVGAYLNIDDVKLLQKILKREIKLNTRVIARNDNKYYFVYTNKYKTKDEAVSEIKRLYKLNIKDLINGKIWMYRSHE